LNSKKIKVLIVATTKFELDGITNVILNYYRAIDKIDMQIDFVIPNDIRKDLKLELESFNSHIYKISGRIKKTWLYVNELSKIINKNNYDIIHAHGNSCTLALEMYVAKKAGVKVRISHSHNTKSKYKIIHKILRGLFDSNYTHAFACGKKAGEWLFNDKSFEIINNGINLEKYKYDVEMRKKYRNKYKLEGKKVIGHIGHFCYQKNHDYLIDVFSELYKIDDSYRLILIGDGKLRSNVEKKVNDLRLSMAVIFTGKTLDVSQLMQAMDMIIMPSRFEGLPLTLVEAQTACLPCFVSDTVSKEVRITNLVKFLSLERGSKEWATQINKSNIINRQKIKDRILNEIIQAGYSITDNAKKMKELYKTYYNK